MSFRVDAFEFRESWLEIRELMDVGPLVRSWSSMELEDLEDLIYLAIAIE